MKFSPYLEKRIDERRDGRTLCQRDQGYEQAQRNQHGNEPPALIAPEKSQELPEDTNV